MSSADTCLISASTILTLDVVSRMRNTRPAQYLKITKITVITIGLVSWMIATTERGIISSLLLAYSVFVGGVVVSTLLSFFRKELRISSDGAFWAVIVGGATAIAGRIHGGILLKTLITAKGQVFSAFSVDAKVLGLFVMIRQAQREDRILL